MAWDVVASLDSPTAGAFTFTGLTLTSYKVIRVEIEGVTVTTDGTDIKLTFYVSGSEVTANYAWFSRSLSTSGTTNADSATAQAAILLVSNDANFDVGNASTKSFGAQVTVDAPGSTAIHKKASLESWCIGPTGNAFPVHGVGQLDNAGAIDGLKLGGTSNLVAGKVRILGVV